MSIKAVCFDYGGVIAKFQSEEDMASLAALAGVEKTLMKRIYWDNRAIYDQGLVSGPEYYRKILAGVGVFPDEKTIDRIIEEDIRSWAVIDSGTERLMRDIKQAGFKLGILSNMIQPFIDWARKSIALFSLPDAGIYSCEVDSVKPEEKIYRLLLSALDCKAEELVFFDDLEVNIEGAQKLGISAFLWKGPEEARKKLKELCAGSFQG
jgi:HAD superfamily hydrolase (TIGR01509 family)